MAVGPSGHARRPAKVNVVRYADDFIVTGVNRELLEQRVKPVLEAFLAARGLQLAPEKTLLTHITRGFDFLGQNVRKYGDKLLITPSRKSVQTLLKKVREILGKHKAATQAQVIQLLNPILRGWATYHRHVVAAATFGRVDHLVWRKLWGWAKRRHPRKKSSWIKARYFHRYGIRDWVFGCGKTRAPQGPQSVLYRTTTLPIKRHVKVRSGANPFSPEWTAYFQSRSDAG
jgi:RNA-directed DNA polymerase